MHSIADVVNLIFKGLGAYLLSVSTFEKANRELLTKRF